MFVLITSELRSHLHTKFDFYLKATNCFYARLQSSQLDRIQRRLMIIKLRQKTRFNASNFAAKIV